MDVLEYITLYCPYCGEKNEITIERIGVDQSYSEDCQICCRSMQLEVVLLSGDDIEVRVSREDEL